MEFLFDADGKPVKDDYVFLCPSCLAAFTADGIGPPEKVGDKCPVCDTPVEAIEEG